MKRLLAEGMLSAAALLLMAVALGLSTHALQRGVPGLFDEFVAPLPEGVGRVSPDDVVENWREVVFVDAREVEAYQTDHIALAVSVPAGKELDSKILERLQRAEIIVVYCSGPDCGASTKVVRLLVDSGVSGHLSVLEGGLPAWKEKGYPMVFPGNDAPPPPPRGH